MSSQRRAVALVVGVFVAVVAVVIGATASTSWRSSNDKAPAAAPAKAPSDQAPAQLAPASGADAAITSIADLPDTSSLLADAALAARPGTIVAQGDQVVVERVTLTTPTTVVRDGVSTVVTEVFRVTISAGPYELRDMPAVVSIGDLVLGRGAESTDLSSLTAYTYDAAAAQGSSVAVTYGVPGQAPAAWSTAIEVV